MFPQQVSRIPTNPSDVIYCDGAPVATIDQFYNFVLTTFPSPTPNMCIVSPELPMKSAAGWYVGRCCYNWDASCSRWWYDNYDRTSDYFLTESDAADHASWARWTFGDPQNGVMQ